MGDKKSDLTVAAGLMMAKQELERKTGVARSSSAPKKGDQEKFLKDLKKKKQNKLELDYDIMLLNREHNYPVHINAEDVLAVVKQKMWEKPKDVELINIALVAEMKLGNLSKAEVDYKKAINIESDNVDILYNGAVLKMREGKLDEALEEMKLLIVKKEDTDFFYLMAMILILKNREEEAVNILGKVLKSESDFEKSYNFFVMLSLLKENRDKAIEILLKLIENRGTYGNKITLESLKIDEGKDADFKLIEEMVKELESLDSEFLPCAKVLEGKFYMTRSNYLKSENSFEDAIEIYPGCICSLVEKAVVYREERKYEEAYEVVRKGLLLDSSFKPLLAEGLYNSYFLKQDKEADKFVKALYELDKEILLEIYNENEVLLKCKIDALRDGFILKVNTLMEKYMKSMPRFRIKSGNIMDVYKNFKSYKLCDCKNALKK